MEYITSRIQPFTNDNRSGIPGTLHRISPIRNRQGKPVTHAVRAGLKLIYKHNLNPAIIAACKSEHELNTYLYYLDNKFLLPLYLNLT